MSNPGRTDGIGILRKVSIGPMKDAFQYYDGEQFEDLTFHKAFRTDGKVEIGGSIDLHDVVVTGDAEVQGTAPQWKFVETDASADNKKWGVWADGEDFGIRTLDDAETSFENAIFISRTGYVVDSVYVGTALELVADCVNDRVGVGTSAPSSKLHVESSEYSVARFKRLGAGAGASMLFIDGDSYYSEFIQSVGHFYVCGPAAGNIYFRSGVTNRMYIDSTFGNLNLNNALQVLGSGESSFAGAINCVGNLKIDSDTSRIYFGDGQDSSIYYDGTNIRYNSAVAGAGKHYFYGKVYFDTFVGIGYTDASCPLETLGRVRVTSNTIPSGASGGGLELGYYSAGNIGVIHAYDRTASTYKGVYYDGSQHQFAISGTVKATVTSSGNLSLVGSIAQAGSSTNTFAGQLDVANSLRCTSWTTPSSGSGVEVGYTGGIGYVQAYNRAGSAFLPLIVRGLNFAIDSSGNLQMDGNLSVDGTGVSSVDGDLVVYGYLIASDKFRTLFSTDDVSNPPTEAQLNAAFYTPTSSDWGCIAVIDDNGGGSNVYLCVTATDGSSGFDWYYVQLTKA